MTLVFYQRTEALSQWGSPETPEELNAVFLRYLQADPRTPSTPFSNDPLLDETKLILPHLLELTKRGWITVGSQPAADAILSNDPVFGWGPADGYVFQKAFVEFFCDGATVESLKSRIEDSGGWITWFATNLEVSNQSDPDPAHSEC